MLRFFKYKSPRGFVGFRLAVSVVYVWFSIISSIAANSVVPIGVIGPNIERHSCGPSRALGALLAAKDVNDKNGRWVPALSRLSNFNFSVQFGDTKKTGAGGVTAAMQCAGLADGAAQSDADRAVIIVGPISSSVSRTTSLVMNVFGVGLISYASSDPVLSDKVQYPLFFRTAGYKSASPLVALTLELGVPVVTIIYSTKYDDDDVGFFQSQFNLKQIEVTKFKFTESAVGDNEHEIAPLLEIVRLKDWRVLLALCTDRDCLSLFTLAAERDMMQASWVWLGFDSLAAGQPYQLGIDMGRSKAEMDNIFQGVIATKADDQGDNYEAFDMYWRCSRSQKDSAGGVLYRDCGLEKEIRDLQRAKQEWFVRTPSAADFEFRNDTFEKACDKRTYAYDAVVAVALAANALIAAGNIVSKASILEALRHVNFEGLSGSVAFTSTQDRAANYVLYNTLGGHSMVRIVGIFIEGEEHVRWNDGTNLSAASLVWPGNITTVPSGRVPTPSPTVDLPSCALPLVLGLDGLCEPCPQGSQPIGLGLPRGAKVLSVAQAMELGINYRCVPCPIGWFGPADQATCRKADPGYFQNSSGQTLQLACPPGFSNPNEGMAQCNECDRGSYSSGASPDCILCPVGNFSDERGKSSCTSCGSNLITHQVGSRSLTACGCGQGQYLPAPKDWHQGRSVKKEEFLEFSPVELNPEQRRCEDCPWGMYCAGLFPKNVSILSGFDLGRHMQPVTKERFFAMEEKPYTAYMCKAQSWCPGNRIPGQTCADHRTAFICGKCEEGHTPSKDGSCRKCDSGDKAPFIMFLSLFVGVLPIMTYIGYDVNIAHNRQTAKHVALSSGHIVLYFLEACAIMNDMSIDWPSPLGEIYKSTSVFSFNLDLLKPACAITWKFKAKYLMSVSLPLMLGTYLVLLFAAARLLSLLSKTHWISMKLDRTVCTYGILYVALYVAVCRSTLRIFECFKIDLEGRRQLSAFSYVECYSDKWWSMFPVGVLMLLLYGVVTMAFAAWVCKVAPRFFMENHAMFCKCFGFLFHEFRKDRWWWLPVVLLRNLMLPMALSIAPGNGRFQKSIHFMVNLSYLVCLLWFWPWLTSAVNVLDFLSMGIGLLLLGALSDPFVDVAVDDTDSSVYAVIMTIVLISTFVSLAMMWGSNFLIHMTNRVNRACHTSFDPQRAFHCVLGGCFPKKASDSALCKMLQRICSAILARKPQELIDKINALSDSDRSSFVLFVSMILNEVLETKSAIAPGLPRRLNVDQTLCKELSDGHHGHEHHTPAMHSSRTVDRGWSEIGGALQGSNDEAALEPEEEICPQKTEVEVQEDVGFQIGCGTLKSKPGSDVEESAPEVAEIDKTPQSALVEMPSTSRPAFTDICLIPKEATDFTNEAATPNSAKPPRSRDIQHL